MTHGTYPASNWEDPAPKRALVIGADGAHVSDFVFDGTVYVNKYRDQICAVYNDTPASNDVGTTFNIYDCTVDSLYNGFFYVAAADERTTGWIMDCELLGLGVLYSGSGAQPQNQGHAGIWIVGPGILNVSISDTLFQGCHDGLEVAQDGVAGRLVLTNCTFDHNENGLELAAAGAMNVDVTCCHFIGNQNLWNPLSEMGMKPFLIDGTPNSPAGLFVHGAFARVTVRSSDFLNNAFGVVIWGEGIYDLGETGTFEPGLNIFDFDFTEWTTPGVPDPVRVCLFVKAPLPLHAAPTVLAGGNTWFHAPQGSGYNQDTDSAGCLTGPVSIQTNVFLSSAPGATTTVLFPPGPQVGYIDPTTSEPWDRNYSLETGVSIDFGDDCLP